MRLGIVSAMFLFAVLVLVLFAVFVLVLFAVLVMLLFPVLVMFYLLYWLQRQTLKDSESSVLSLRLFSKATKVMSRVDISIFLINHIENLSIYYWNLRNTFKNPCDFNEILLKIVEMH